VVNNKTIETLESVDFEIVGFQNGTYNVEWWNTYTGEVVKTESIQAVGGRIALYVENLDKDVAIKIVSSIIPM